MKTLPVVFMALLLTSLPAAAQERGRFGIAMGYPNTVRFLWHVTDRIAIEPLISFSDSSSESRLESELTFNGIVVSRSVITTSVDGWSMSPGFNVRFTVASWDDVDAYIAPGYSYTRASSTITTTTDSAFTSTPSLTREITVSGHEVRGVFGVQYTPHRRFGVFGEVGLRYGESQQALTSETETRAFGNTSAAGVVLYF